MTIADYGKLIEGQICQHCLRKFPDKPYRFTPDDLMVAKIDHPLSVNVDDRDHPVFLSAHCSRKDHWCRHCTPIGEIIVRVRLARPAAA